MPPPGNSTGNVQAFAGKKAFGSADVFREDYIGNSEDNQKFTQFGNANAISSAAFFGDQEEIGPTKADEFRWKLQSAGDKTTQMAKAGSEKVKNWFSNLRGSPNGSPLGENF